MQKREFLSQNSDEELFGLVKENQDTAAFRELYQRYWVVLVDKAYKRLDSIQKAEDIVQTIFIDLYQRRESIELTHSLKAYLFQALKFRVLNEFRANALKERYRRELFFSPLCKNDLANDIEAKELDLKIHKIIDGLPEKCRQVFLLSRRENKSNMDISRDLNISVSTVEKHIGKALKTFRCQI